MYPRLKRVRRGDQVHEYVQLVEGRREAGSVGRRVHSARPACGRRAPRGRPAARRRPLPAPARAGRAGRRGRADARPGAGHPRRGDRGAGGEPAERPGPALRRGRLGRRLRGGRAAGGAGRAAQRRPAGPGAGRARSGRRRRPGPHAAGHLGALRGGSEPTAPGPDRGALRRRLPRLRAGCQGLGGGPHRGPAGAGAVRHHRAGGDPVCPAGLVTVIDSAAGNLKTLAAIDRQKLRFVVPLRADNGWAARFDVDLPGGIDALPELDHVAQREQHLPSQLRTRYRGQLVDYPAVDPKTKSRHAFRVAYTWSSEEARSVADARERALAKAEAALAKVRNGLGGRYYKTVADVEKRVARVVGPKIEPLLVVTVGKTRASKSKPSKPTLAWRRNPAAIAAAARLDGLYALATNLPDRPDRPLTAQDVLDTYKDQWIAEQRNRDAKRPTQLRVRPIFLHTDQRIQALFGVIGIALLIFGLIEADLCRALPADDPRLPGLLPEGRTAKPTARNILVAFEHRPHPHRQRAGARPP